MLGMYGYACTCIYVCVCVCPVEHKSQSGNCSLYDMRQLNRRKKRKELNKKIKQLRVNKKVKSHTHSNHSMWQWEGERHWEIEDETQPQARLVSTGPYHPGSLKTQLLWWHSNRSFWFLLTFFVVHAVFQFKHSSKQCPLCLISQLLLKERKGAI